MTDVRGCGYCGAIKDPNEMTYFGHGDRIRLHTDNPWLPLYRWPKLAWFCNTDCAEAYYKGDDEEDNGVADD